MLGYVSRLHGKLNLLLPYIRVRPPYANIFLLSLQTLVHGFLVLTGPVKVIQGLDLKYWIRFKAAAKISQVVKKQKKCLHFLVSL